MKEVNVQNHIDLIASISFFKNHAKSLIIWTISGFVLSIIVAIFFITPQYKSTVEILVNQKTNDTEAQYTAQQADLQVINTYKDLIEKDIVLSPVLKQARKKNNYKGNLSSLKESIKIDTETNSQVMSVSVVEDNPYLAADLANYISKEFISKIKSIMKTNNVTIVSKAKPKIKAFSPNKKIYAIVGLVMGFIVGLLVNIVKVMLDRTIKDESYLSDQLGVVNLGSVFHFNSDGHDEHKITVIARDNKYKTVGGRRRV